MSYINNVHNRRVRTLVPALVVTMMFAALTPNASARSWWKRAVADAGEVKKGYTQLVNAAAADQKAIVDAEKKAEADLKDVPKEVIDEATDAAKFAAKEYRDAKNAFINDTLKVKSEMKGQVDTIMTQVKADAQRIHAQFVKAENLGYWVRKAFLNQYQGSPLTAASPLASSDNISYYSVAPTQGATTIPARVELSWKDSIYDGGQQIQIILGIKFDVATYTIDPTSGVNKLKIYNLKIGPRVILNYQEFPCDLVEVELYCSAIASTLDMEWKGGNVTKIEIVPLELEFTAKLQNSDKAEDSFKSMLSKIGVTVPLKYSLYAKDTFKAKVASNMPFDSAKIKMTAMVGIGLKTFLSSMGSPTTATLRLDFTYAFPSVVFYDAGAKSAANVLSACDNYNFAVNDSAKEELDPNINYFACASRESADDIIATVTVADYEIANADTVCVSSGQVVESPVLAAATDYIQLKKSVEIKDDKGYSEIAVAPVSAQNAAGLFRTVPPSDPYNNLPGYTSETNGTFTVSFWSKLTMLSDMTGSHCMIQRTEPTSKYTDFMIGSKIDNSQAGKPRLLSATISASNSLSFNLYQKYEITGKTDLAQYSGKWVHIALTFDGNALTLYLNGNKEGAITFNSSYKYTSSWSGSNPIVVGKDPNVLGWLGFRGSPTGTITDVLLESEVRTPSEIYSNMEKFKKVLGLDFENAASLTVDSSGTEAQITNRDGVFNATGGTAEDGVTPGYSTSIKLGSSVTNGYMARQNTGLVVSDNSAFKPTEEDFTMTFWMKPEASVIVSNQLISNQDRIPIIVKGSEVSSAVFSFAVYLQNKKLAAVVDDVNSIRYTITSSVDLNSSNWIHVGIVKSGAKWQLFLNGILDGETTLLNTATKWTSDPIYFGTAPSSNRTSAAFFKWSNTLEGFNMVYRQAAYVGLLNDYSLYSRAMSPVEVAYDYRRNMLDHDNTLIYTALGAADYTFKRGTTNVFDSQIPYASNSTCIAAFGDLAGRHVISNYNGKVRVTYTSPPDFVGISEFIVSTSTDYEKIIVKVIE